MNKPLSVSRNCKNDSINYINNILCCRVYFLFLFVQIPKTHGISAGLQLCTLAKFSSSHLQIAQRV